MRTPIFVGVPWVKATWGLKDTIQSLCNSDVPLHLVVLGNGPDRGSAMHIREFMSRRERDPEARCLVETVNWLPGLPSLAAAWNLLLATAWSQGHTCAVLANPDILVSPHAVQRLVRTLEENDALLVTGIAVDDPERLKEPDAPLNPEAGGGPCYSFFTISRECHEKYPFDPLFTPCYCEDVDHHRRIMLGGEGRRIYAVDLPFWHAGSGTLNSMSPEERSRTEEAITNGARAYYARKWGGPVNEETVDGLATPLLFKEVWS